MKKSHLLIVCFCMLMFAGCGSQVSVKGKVTFTDGSPVTRGGVEFLTPTYTASGPIQPDGTYVIGSKKSGDGLPKGTYTVTVWAYEEIENASGNPMAAKPAKPLIDLKYSSQHTSGLTCDVQGATVFDIKVEPFTK